MKVFLISNSEERRQFLNLDHNSLQYTIQVSIQRFANVKHFKENNEETEQTEVI